MHSHTSQRSQLWDVSAAAGITFGLAGLLVAATMPEMVMLGVASAGALIPSLLLGVR